MAAFSEHNPASQHAILHSVCQPNAARNAVAEWTQAQLVQRCTVLCGTAPTEPKSIGSTLRGKLQLKKLVSYREVDAKKTRIWFATEKGRKVAQELLKFAHDPKGAESYLRTVKAAPKKKAKAAAAGKPCACDRCGWVLQCSNPLCEPASEDEDEDEDDDDT